MTDEDDDKGGGGRPGVGLATRTRPKTQKPSQYKVLLLNDDYTPMEFVVHVLKAFFSMDTDQATRVMLHVHQKGVGVCGIFTYEVAETKVTQVMDFAAKNQHPLQCTLEKGVTKAALIVGAGDATGGAIARAFAREGFVACVNRRARNAEQLETLAQSIRDEGFAAQAYPGDARIEDDVAATVDAIERDVGPIEVAVFNIGANVNFSVLETTAQVYRKVWEMAAFAGFLMGREVARRMVERQSGTIIFTGATASLRGGKGFSAFSGAKGALRMLAQSMARELGPQNIHVAHVVIDGGIDTEFIRGIRPDFDEAKAADKVLSPDAIAAQYVSLHKQHRSAWTHEMDLRPWAETF